MQKVSGVYVIRNLVTGELYVGSSSRVNHRFAEHRYLLKSNKHHAPYLQHSWNKHGADAFEFSIIEECAVDALIEREQFHIDLWKPKYNFAQVAGTRRGVPQSEAARNKIKASLANVDFKALIAKQQATRAQRAAEGYDYSPSPETKAKLISISRARKGVPTGRVYTDEQRERIAASNKAFWTPGKHVELGLTRAGTKHDDVAREKMSAAKRGKPSVKRRDPTKCANMLHDWIDGASECRACANIAQNASRRRRIEAAKATT